MRDVQFKNKKGNPYEFITFDMVFDIDNKPWYVIQAKRTDLPGNPKMAIVFREEIAGSPREIVQFPEVYGPPKFSVRPDGKIIVSGTTHEATVTHIHHSDPVPGWPEWDLERRYFGLELKHPNEQDASTVQHKPSITILDQTPEQ